MTLFLHNEDVRSVLTMDIALSSLEKAYQQLIRGEAVCRPRVDIEIPTHDPAKLYRWGTMEGGAVGGYFAIRMKSDVLFEQTYEGVRTQEKYCVRPGTFCGLIFLFDTQNGEPLALINDGYLQHMRVGADSGLGVKYMARADARVVGMLGSGGMARSHLEAFLQVRDIKRVQVFSPTRAHREAFAEEAAAKYGIEAVAVDNPRDAHRGADILAGCTDAVEPVLFGDWLEPGCHLTCIGGRLDAKVLERIDVSLRLGDAPAPRGRPEFGVDDEYLSYPVRPPGSPAVAGEKPARGAFVPERVIGLQDVLDQHGSGRTSPEQISFSERGNIQGAQFHAVAGEVFRLAREKGLGRELPTEWFLQDIRN